VIVTSGVAALPAQEQAELLQKVQRFADFTEDNDSYGEHDFWQISHGGELYYWKIDYYDPLMDEAGITQGSETPENPRITSLVSFPKTRSV
jgi:hypothetical protein